MMEIPGTNRDGRKARRPALRSSQRWLMAAILPLCASASSPMLGAAQTASEWPATLPNGRQIAPVGEWVTVAPFPVALALRPDGKQLTAPSLGFPFALNIVENPVGTASGEPRKVTQIPPGFLSKKETEVDSGVAYSPDGKRLYVATGNSGAVEVLATDDWRKLARIDLNGPDSNALASNALASNGLASNGLASNRAASPDARSHVYQESFAGALTLSADGNTLFVIDQANWRVVVVDTSTRKRIASLATGVNPIALCLSPDNRRLYIANSGLFEYKTIPGADDADRLHTGLRFPPFGYPSREAQNGAEVEGKKIPGLGDANDPRGSSLWTYDVSRSGRPHLSAKLRLGAPIDTASNTASNRVVGGAAPSALAAGATAVYVALAHEDAVAVVSPDGRSTRATIPLTPFTGPEFQDGNGNPLRGIMPSGLALSGDRLYVAESGIDALAVVDRKTNRVLGHLPAGWSPSAVLVSPDGQTIYVANAKGKGSGPNGGANFNPNLHGAYIGELELGGISVIPAAEVASPEHWTEAVVKNNRAAQWQGNSLPRLGHVLLVIRENRTFDEVFGDLPGADGDLLLARFSLHGRVQGDPAMQDLRVTPNAHRMAAQFATSDRYFTDSDVSVDGHRWAIGIAPTPWMAMAWPTTYGGRRKGNPFSEAPGRRALGGATDGPMPEDEPEFGSLWEHAANSGLKVLNYGESLELEGMDEMAGSEPEGQRLLLNAPVPRPVFAATDRNFATANMGIPDIVRAQEFLRDFGARLKSGDVPAMIVMRLGNDHTAGPRPADGYPLHESYVADNDLALGQILDFLSHSSIWKDTAVFVTEDDPQSGVDHVDAHRSILLAMSPWIRTGYLSHRHSSMGSIQKTVYELLGIGPLNLEDALASDLSDMFANTPNLAPYDALPADPRVFDPAQARIARPKSTKEKAELSDIDDSKKIRKTFPQPKPANPGAASTGPR